MDILKLAKFYWTFIAVVIFIRLIFQIFYAQFGADYFGYNFTLDTSKYSLSTISNISNSTASCQNFVTNLNNLSSYEREYLERVCEISGRMSQSPSSSVLTLFGGQFLLALNVVKELFYGVALFPLWFYNLLYPYVAFSPVLIVALAVGSSLLAFLHVVVLAETIGKLFGLGR